MDKFIKDIEDIISDFASPLITEKEYYRFYGRNEVVEELARVLQSYTDRHSISSQSDSHVISSHQLHCLNIMVNVARDRKAILEKCESSDPMTVEQGYLHGYVDAVHGMIEILGIDFKRLSNK